VSDRTGWAADIYAAFATQRIAATHANVCAVLAVTEQESGFRVDRGRPLLLSRTSRQHGDQQHAGLASAPHRDGRRTRAAFHPRASCTSSNAKHNGPGRPDRGAVTP
jgi:hypothetical protein